MNPETPRVVLTALGLVPSTGGTVQSVRNFQRALDAVVISFTDPCQLAAEGSAVTGATHVETARSQLGRLYSVPRRRCLAAADELANRADMLTCHVLFRYHTHFVARHARRCAIPYWVVPHGCLDPYVFTYRSIAKRIWMRCWGKRFLHDAARVIFATERERQKAGHQYVGENTCVIRWPVAPVKQSDSEVRRHRVELRAEWRIPEQDRVLLSLGRMHPMKRLDQLVCAFADAAAPSCHLVVVGPEDGVTRDELYRLAAARGLRRIRVVGPAYGERKTAMLLASDGFVSLSRRENFGYGAAEALAAGLPVVLSPGNDLGHDLHGQGCGWLLDDQHNSTAARAICEWASRPMSELRILGENGRRFARENLSFEVFSSKLRKLAHETLAPRAIHE